MQVELLAADGKPVAKYNPEEILHVSIDTTLERGVYYLAVSGAANANTSSYGSLGSYHFGGTFSPLEITQRMNIKLAGQKVNGKHELSWNVSGEEEISELVLEKSTDGNNFISFSTLLKSSNLFEYSPELQGQIYYRMKTSCTTGRIMYSNVIVLGSAPAEKDLFRISSPVRTEISLMAQEDFSFQLSDMSGRMIRKGTGSAGANRINVSRVPNGIYFMQIISSSQKNTQRIVKL